MNPFIYKNFQNDMKESVQDFVLNTDFDILYLSDSCIVLSNNKININFCLDGASMIETISTFNGKYEKSLFQLFEENNLIQKYPFDYEHKFTREEWNKIKVKNILYVLKTDLKRYIE